MKLPAPTSSHRRSWSWPGYLSWQFLLSLYLLALLSACGGSGSAPGSVNGVPVTGGNSNSGTPKISLSLQDAKGAASSTSSPSNPLTAIATILDGNGAPLANTIVEFAVGPNLVVMVPLSGSVATDAGGRASVQLQIKDLQTAQSQSGAADTLRASVSIGGKSYTTSAVFRIAPDSGNSSANLSLSLLDSRGQVSRTTSPDNPLTAQAKVTDAGGAPLADVVVSFVVDPQLSVTTPQSGTALTNSNGIASVVVAPKDLSTAQNQAGAADTVRAAISVGGKTSTAFAVYQMGAPVTNSSNAAMSMSLVDAQGATSRIASLDSPLRAQARVVDGNNLPIPNVIVTFTSNASLTTITPLSGSALTNANGIASVILAPKDLQTANAQSGAADTVRATATANGKNINASAVYQMGASSGNTASATLSLALQDSSGAASSSAALNRPLTAKATLRDARGNPIANTIVSFATAGTLTTISPASASALTDSQGVASITLAPKDLSTALNQVGSADVLRATATVGSNPLLATANFQLGSTSLSLVRVAPDAASTNIAAYGSVVLKADLQANGLPYTSETVSISFSSPCASAGRASLPTSVTTSNGRAQATYTDLGCAGSDAVSASFGGVGGYSATVVSASPQAASLNFISATPSDQAIVIKGSGGIGRSETASLVFQALDNSGRAFPNQEITFAVNSLQPVTLQTSSAFTDNNGRATAVVNSGSLPTTFRVIASFKSAPQISTISGVITVSNGVPTQSAFTLSAVAHNIEGFNIDNNTTTIAALLADASGNPVPDGTPVLFDTDSGAIGSSANGGCATINGACTVTLRSQNPRYGIGDNASKRAGLATIGASTSTASVNITGQIGVFFSGSYAVNVFPYGGNTAYSTSGNTLSNNACGVYSLVLEVNDRNFNPMPAGSKVSALNISSDLTVGSIIPINVPSIVPHDSSGNRTLIVADMAARQGSLHTIPITLPNSCNTSGSTTKTGTFSISIAAPSGAEVVYPFSLPYPSN